MHNDHQSYLKQKQKKHKMNNQNHISNICEQ